MSVKITVLANTRTNRVLPSAALALANAPEAFSSGDAIVEFAARLCYNSVARMGTNPDFVDDKVRRGHLDVLEHDRLVFFSEGHKPDDILELYGSVKGFLADPYTDNEAIISLNRRTLIESPILNRITSAVFSSTNGARTPSRDVYLYGRKNVSLLSLVYDGVSLSPDEQLRHCSATFLIEGISRTASHQIVRHRSFSISQESQRYVDQSTPNFVVPQSIELDEHLVDKFNKGVNESYRLYTELRGRGVKKEDARFVLPEAAVTRMVVTATFEGWKHFLDLRLRTAAQWEIRGAAIQINSLLAEIAPDIFREL